MNQHNGCRYLNLTRDYTPADLATFHGHLGPFIVLGYRIGRHVRRTFCDDPFAMQAVIHCAGTPPESCLVDGVQLGCGCTLGKRNIEIRESSIIRCEFISDESTMVIVPHPFDLPPRGEGDYEVSIERYAEELFASPDDRLFTYRVE